MNRASEKLEAGTQPNSWQGPAATSHRWNYFEDSGCGFWRILVLATACNYGEVRRNTYMPLVHAHTQYILIEHGHIWNSIGILATSSKPPGPTLTNLRCMATSNATWAFDGAVASRRWCCQWTPFWRKTTILTSLIQPTSKIATLAEFQNLEAMINRQRLPNEECRDETSILNQPSWSAPCFFWVPCLGGEGLLSLCFAMGFISFWWQASFFPAFCPMELGVGWELEGM